MNEKDCSVEEKFNSMSIAQLISLFGKSENDGLLEVVLNKRGYYFETIKQIWIGKKYTVYKTTIKKIDSQYDDIYGDFPSIKEEDCIIAKDISLNDAEELVAELQKREKDKNVTYSYAFDRF